MTRWAEIKCPRCAELEAEVIYTEKRLEHAFCRNDRQAKTIDDLTTKLAAERERGFWLGRSCGGSKAEDEARRFLDRVAALRDRHADDEHMQIYFYAVGFKERAAMKRASMDLSRALVELRRSYQ